jgi:hypothetical protein
MGHIWLDENVGPSLRERFLELRGLRAWNASSDPWRMRGYEQSAEVLACGLGERIITPSIPDIDFEHRPASRSAYRGVARNARPC